MRLENAAMANGTKYFAVLTAPIETPPPLRPAIMSSAPLAIDQRSFDAFGQRHDFAPASVRIIPSPVR